MLITGAKLSRGADTRERKMGGLLKGGASEGSSENDPGTQGGDNGGGKMPTESEVVMHSEKNTPGKPSSVGFNPTSKS
jgi:hypothetical protein